MTRQSTIGAVLAVALCWCGEARAQAVLPTAQICRLGDLKLESGQVVQDFRMSYITFGRLDERKANAVLSLHGLRGNRNSQTQWAGPGRAFDTDRLFVVQPDTLGAVTPDPDATTSPTRSGLNMGFPRFTIRDMVNAEHRMLTECLGITHLMAVTGTSMGGMEAYQWAVSYPEFMDVVVPMISQPRSTRQGDLTCALARQVVMLDPKWRDGDYPADDAPRLGIGVGVAIQEAFGASSPWFEETYATKDDVYKALADNETAASATVLARDWVYRTWAIASHDISRSDPGGDFVTSARSIKARVLAFVNCHDQLLVPRESGNFEVIQAIPSARLVDLADIRGHGASSSPVAVALITAEVRALLDRVAEHKPGIRGARFPRGWTEPRDVCAGER